MAEHPEAEIDVASDWNSQTAPQSERPVSGAHRAKGAVPAMSRSVLGMPCIVMAALSVVVFFCLLAWVGIVGITPLDEAAISFVVGMRSDPMTSTMTQITYLAMPVAMLVISFAVAPFVFGRHPWLAMLGNISGSALLNTALKYLICRARPDRDLWLVPETGYSFPSGHAMAAMSFYGFIIWLVLRQTMPAGKKNRSSAIWIAGLSLVIFAIGASRVYLCVHYATDVLSGYAASFVWLAIYTTYVAPLLLGPALTP